MSTPTEELMIIEKQDGVYIVRFLASALLDPAQVEQADREFMELVAREPEPRIVIALDTVEQLSSLMLSVLIRLRAEVGDRKGQTALAAVPDRLQSLFELVRIGDVFETYATAQEAVTALAPAE